MRVRALARGLAMLCWRSVEAGGMDIYLSVLRLPVHAAWLQQSHYTLAVAVDHPHPEFWSTSFKVSSRECLADRGSGSFLTPAL